MEKPDNIKGRNAEWSALYEFAVADRPRGGVGLLYGRRRTGKSFLLRRLVGAVGGLYFQATESERPDALREFGQAVASVNVSPGDSPAEPIVYGDWTDALERRSGLVVIDELPYLLEHSPELPSLLQRIADDSTNGSRLPVRFLLCGSSLSIMTSLLHGQQPLRGRATLDMYLRPMDASESARLWECSDREVAIRLHAIFGGAPGYRALTNGLPTSVSDLGQWLATNVLNPNHALYQEDATSSKRSVRSLTDPSTAHCFARSLLASRRQPRWPPGCNDAGRVSHTR